MKKVAILAVLFLTSLLAGCNSNTSSSSCPMASAWCVGNCCNLVETGPERQARISLTRTLDCRQIPDDWDYIWLQERNSRLTQWHPYAGW